MKPHPLKNHLCPLCGDSRTKKYHSDKRRLYLRCHNCGLIFVPSEYFLSPEAEKERYDNHNNNFDDHGYREFLSRLYEPLQKRLKPESCGLDFGSGPSPVLSQIFENYGFKMTLYDPFYADNLSAFAKSYDFITAAEVFEHLHQPGKEIKRLCECLVEGGWLGIMTNPVPNSEAFKEWYYIRDITHVCFYSDETFQWIASNVNADIVKIEPDIILFHKSKRIK